MSNHDVLGRWSQPVGSVGAPSARDPGWLHRWSRTAEPSANLFCFGYAGGSASVFRLWPSELPEQLDLWAVQLPGRGTRWHEPAIASIPVLVDALVDAMRPHLARPFAFFGHSMGALLAFEVAKALMAQTGVAPCHLFVSGRRPPHMAGTDPELHRLPDGEFVQAINRRYGGIPQEVLQSAEVLALLLPALRADIAALERFRSGSRDALPCAISAFGGADDQVTPRDHLEAWRPLTAGAFRTRIFPGGHFYLDAQRAAILADVSATLAPMLRRAVRPVA